MTYQSIGLGTVADDGTGDTRRVGGDKVNDNFVELYTKLGDASTLCAGITADANDFTFVGDSYNGVWDKSDSSLEFVDNAKASFGTGGDLQIYHDGSNSYINDQGTGNITLMANQVNFVNAAGNETLMQVNQDGAVGLYYDNSVKFATTSAGATLTGTLNVTSNIEVGSNIIFEGSTADAYETTITVTDPTADRTITVPNITGTLVTTGDTGTVNATMLSDNSVTLAKMADDAVGSAELLSLSTLLIKNSSGTTLKTCHCAGA